MKKYITYIWLMASIVLVSCANEDAKDNGGENNNSGKCEENAYNQCYNATTAQQCIGGSWQMVRCASDEACSNSTHKCERTNNGGGGENGGGNNNNGGGGENGGGNNTDTNFYGPTEWWKNVDVSQVSDLNSQSNVAGTSCNSATFHESCNSGKILYCENSIVKQYDCSANGYDGCAYFTALNFADCVNETDKCDVEGNGISGCTSDDEYFDYFYNGYCALSDKGDKYWVYENSYCSGTCTNDKGCAVTPCTSKYKANCDGEYGYICYEDKIAMLNCHQLNTQCVLAYDNPECDISNE